jgi:hypothetical protein
VPESLKSSRFASFNEAYISASIDDGFKEAFRLDPTEIFLGTDFDTAAQLPTESGRNEVFVDTLSLDLASVEAGFARRERMQLSCFDMAVLEDFVTDDGRKARCSCCLHRSGS